MMISSAFQQLYDEHDLILRMIDRMRSVISGPESVEATAEIRELLSFFREYADGYHHAKEEEVLFPRLQQLVPAFESIVVDLTDHHEMFRELLARATRALDAGNWGDLEMILEGYATSLTDHISAENDELFVAGDDMLDDDEKDRIRFMFIDIDNARGVERKRALEEHAGAF